MKTKAATVSQNGADSPQITAFFRECLRELTLIHRANKADDAEIRRLQSSTRKKLDRIWEKLRHVQAVR